MIEEGSGAGLCKISALNIFFQPFHKTCHDQSVTEMSLKSIMYLRLVFYCLQVYGRIFFVDQVKAGFFQQYIEPVINRSF